MLKIATQADVASALAAPLAVVYKHSPICPTSGMAYEEMRSLRRLHQDVPVYMVDVVHCRLLSRSIAEQVGVVHAPAWHGSHFDLRADEIAERLQSLKAETERSD
jgi:bacillithiol system protein YtxJ